MRRIEWIAAFVLAAALVSAIYRITTELGGPT